MGVDLLSAVVAEFLGSGLPADITGGFYTWRVADASRFPYAYVQQEAPRVELTTERHTCTRQTLRVRVYDSDMDVAGTLGDALHDLLKGKSYDWDAGGSTPLVATAPVHARDKDRAFDGAEAWYQERLYTTRVIEQS